MVDFDEDVRHLLLWEFETFSRKFSCDYTLYKSRKKYLEVNEHKNDNEPN